MESAAYFVVAEALTNAARHSGSKRAAVELSRTRTGLQVVVRDEGKGGATTADGADAEGTGLPGMRRRVAALDGTFTVTSPAGGPTVITARRQIPGLSVLVLSQYVEEAYAAELLGGGASGIGYLLKDRVGRVEEFLDALNLVAAGGTALDPEVVTELLTRRSTPLDSLTPREREVLTLMAEGHDNTTIAATLVSTERSVSKHIGNIFLKLGLPPTDTGRRRVLAVLAHLNNP